MAFVWVEDIGKGTVDITKAAVVEIRDNLDQIKDNLACPSHNTTDYAANNVVDDAAADAGYDAADKLGVDSSYNSTYNSGYQLGVDGANYGSIMWGVKSSVLSGYESSVYGGNTS